jgi:hypothetical protein
MSAKRIDIFNRDNPSGGNAEEHERSNQISGFNQGRGKQHGAALIVMLVIVIMGATIFLVSSLSSAALQIKRDEITAASLAQAKDALIGYAASVDLTSSARPGDLPCPDTNNDGIAETSCGSAAGSNQAQRLGRLPWKTLGLPDLRDGSGERLWYAVSNNFKNNTRTTCTSPGQSGCLDSDTTGTISVFSMDGTRLNDGSGNTGAVAVIIAPSDVLTRTDKTTPQDRSNAGINNPQNYLDTALGKDNANFTDGSSTNGFIQGRIKDNNGNTIVNDQLLVISQDNIMQAIQKRVAGEVKQCLNEYALQNHGRYPWAARVSTFSLSYSDTSNRLFGRVPDTPFDNTKIDSNNYMGDQWGANCNINSSSGWWLNWKEMVFYGLADAYKPASSGWYWNGWFWIWTSPSPPSCPTCIAVNPPSATPDKQFVVLVAGKMLSGQSRSSSYDKGTLSNYLEVPNANGASPFAQDLSSTTFNDTVVFQ